MIISLIFLIALMLAFVWLHLPVKNWLIAGAVFWLVVAVFDVGSLFLNLLFLSLFAGVAVILYAVADVRKIHLTARVMKFVRAAMPPISRTEQEAIDAGTVWWDAELFSGNPDWNRLFAMATPTLTGPEQAFMDGPVEELCEMLDDWEITHELNDLPENVWQHIKTHKFFGLNADPAYGGLGFSAYAQSRILQKLSSRSSTAAVTVMVPNSLGPAELLYHYGTREQKEYYLPRLVSGEEIPCFGLTNPRAGSDAESMPDYGIVCEQDIDGKLVLGFRVSWQKRYITLSPVATLLGLAFKAYDPEGHLGGEVDLGITCALVPTDTQGVTIGRRHLPLNAAFQNGPNQGTEVFVPMDWVIGGQAMVGQGWRMLMESLAAGRGISLPAAAAGTAKLAVRSASAYAVVREQFGTAIGRFEGIEEVLTRMGGLTYLLDAGRLLVTSALAEGHKPAVLSAIVKQQCTDLSRVVINDAMDIHGGKAICMGPGNYLASVYQQIPIGITVEGANILTRSLIIFGQGSMRCHPFLLKEIQAAQIADAEDALEAFDKTFVCHVEHVIANALRCFSFGLTRGKLGGKPMTGVAVRYIGAIRHFSAALAFSADMTLLLLGGKLKRKEMLSGRFADALSYLYLASAAIKRFKDCGENAKEAPLFRWACEYALCRVQEAFHGICKNYPNRFIGWGLRIAIFPTGRYVAAPGDRLSHEVAEILQTPGSVRDRLTEDVFIPSDDNAIIRQLEDAMLLMIKSEGVRRRLRKNDQSPAPGQDYAAWLESVCNSEDITGDERDLLIRTHERVSQVIAVDDFPGR